jgi:DNA modification methylase
MHNGLCNLPEGLDRRQGLEALVSPVATGDPDHTGDTNVPVIAMRSPVSPVSPVARTREGFRSTTRFGESGRVLYARVNFSEPCGGAGDTGDTITSRTGEAITLRRPNAARDGSLGGRRLAPASRRPIGTAAPVPSGSAEDEVPESPEDPVSRPGDLWVLGNHRLLCGDATVLADVERVLGGQLADMTFCDPPYNVDYANTPKDKLRGKHRPILNDDLGSGFDAFLYDACVNIVSVTKGAVYVCMSSSELHTLQRAFTAAGGKWSTFVIWAKNTFTLGRADYQRQYEPILYGWKDGHDHYWCGARDQGDLWFFDKPVRNDLHPTMKPVALVERAIRNSSKSRDIVLDPFGGSGSTLIACEKTARYARLIELDPKYVDTIILRWQEFSGGAATLEGDGRSYEEICRRA